MGGGYKGHCMGKGRVSWVLRSLLYVVQCVFSVVCWFGFEVSCCPVKNLWSSGGPFGLKDVYISHFIADLNLLYSIVAGVLESTTNGNVHAWCRASIEWQGSKCGLICRWNWNSRRLGGNSVDWDPFTSSYNHPNFEFGNVQQLHVYAVMVGSAYNVFVSCREREVLCLVVFMDFLRHLHCIGYFPFDT